MVAERVEAWWAAPALVALGAVLVYFNSLPNGFTYDDVPIIVDNPAVHDLTGFLRVWLTPYWPGPDALARGLYRPLTTFIFAVQWSLGGGSPLPFHVLNLFFHAAASVLVYELLKELVGWKGAFGAALIFAVHPVHVEAVANGVGQAELISTCLLLFAAVVYVRRRGSGEMTGGQMAQISAFFLAGLLAKENAIVLPGLLLALDAAKGRLRCAGYVASVGKIAVLLVGVASVYLALRFLVLGGTFSGNAGSENSFLLDPAGRLLTALSVWPEYLRLLVYPFRLSAMYDPGTIPPAEVLTGAGVVGGLLLLATVAAIGLRWAWPAVGLGSAWFLVTILPVSNLIVPVGIVLAERTLYLPSVAVAIWAGYGLRWVSSRVTTSPTIRPILVGSLAIVLLSFGLRVVLRNPVWANNDVLFETTLRDHPENFRAHWFAALIRVEMGDSIGSQQYWSRAFEIYQGNSLFLTAYANFLLARGNLEEAEEMASRALVLRPDFASGHFVRGRIEMARGRPSSALSHVEALRELGFVGMARQLQDSLRVFPAR